MRPDASWWLLAAGVGVVLLFSRDAAAQSADATTDTTGTTDPETDPLTDFRTTADTDGIAAFAQAIAHAEGYFVPGSVPNRSNNPGDLKIPGWRGGVAGAEGVSVFTSAVEGWARLYHQLNLIRSGRSHVYSDDDTILAVAHKWTDTQGAAWASNVVGWLATHGYDYVTVDTPIGDVLG